LCSGILEAQQLSFLAHQGKQQKTPPKVTEAFAKKNSSETRPEVAENLRLVEHPHAELRMVGWVELGFGV